MGTHWNVRDTSGGLSGEGVVPHYHEVVSLSMTLVGRSRPSMVFVIVLFCSVLVHLISVYKFFCFDVIWKSVLSVF